MGKAAQPYSISTYSIETLRQILSDEANVPLSVVQAKPHLGYFEGYFNFIGAKSILVERDYIDRDYLEDFASYYVRCFHPYPRKCSRLHFFDETITNEEFEAAMKGAEYEKLSGSYLGFVVVKPLPQTIIGRTCLRTYPSDGGRRHYPSVRDYEANIFGLKLVAKQTLAFQEQDHVAAACATSALWSAFQGTGKLFQHPIPSPVSITRAATKNWPRETRTFPNNGLDIIEMAHAIRDVGLEPLMLRADRHDVLKSNLYAYLKAKIPLLLIVDLYNASIKIPLLHRQKPSYLGKHAVAASGYSLGLSKPVPYGGTGLLLKASRIDKFYAHDDQVGPFARMVFTEMDVQFASDTVLKRDFLTTSWRNPVSGAGSIVAQPENLLIPIYHKIRIPFDTISQSVIDFDELLEKMRADGRAPLSERIEWDIYLITVGEFKTDVRSSMDLNEDERLAIQLQPLPRFLWCADGACAGKRVIGLLFDATDIEQGSFFLRAVAYDHALALVLKNIGQNTPADSKFIPRQTQAILHHFAQKHIK